MEQSWTMKICIFPYISYWTLLDFPAISQTYGDRIPSHPVTRRNVLTFEVASVLMMGSGLLGFRKMVKKAWWKFWRIQVNMILGFFVIIPVLSWLRIVKIPSWSQTRLPVVITVRPPAGSGHPTLDVTTDVTVAMGGVVSCYHWIGS